MDDEEMHAAARKPAGKHAHAFFESMDKRGYEYVKVGHGIAPHLVLGVQCLRPVMSCLLTWMD